MYISLKDTQLHHGRLWFKSCITAPEEKNEADEICTTEGAQAGTLDVEEAVRE